MTKPRLLDVLSESTALQGKDVTSVLEHLGVAEALPTRCDNERFDLVFETLKPIDETAIKERDDQIRKDDESANKISTTIASLGYRECKCIQRIQLYCRDYLFSHNYSRGYHRVFEYQGHADLSRGRFAFHES